MGQGLRDVRALIVEDDLRLVERLERALASEVAELRLCHSVKSAVTLLEGWSPQLLVVDVVLPDGDACDVLLALGRLEQVPSIVAVSGAASPTQSFRLSRLGVHTFLTKPFGVEELREAMERALSDPIDIRPQLRDLVGKRPLPEVEDEVRSTMLEEALARSQGARSGAAKLLDVSRQLIQYMLKHQR